MPVDNERERLELNRREGREEDEDKLPECPVWSYAVGHVMNDACAACWFSYLLVYLERVRRISCIDAGVVMFSGQIFDAIATPIGGHLSDVTPGIASLGWSGRKVWYIIGTIIVVVNFWGVFGMNPFEGDKTLSVVYFATGASLFNVGWAIVQVCHLAMGPELTTKESERDRLAKLRYGFTIISNLSVFLLYVWGEGRSRGRAPEGGLANGVWRFQMIACAVLVVGGVCAIIFMRGTPSYKPQDSLSLSTSQKQSRKYDSIQNGDTESGTTNRGGHRRPQRVRWFHWFSISDFYLNAVCFMCSRVVVNISQVYLQFYLLDTLFLGDEALALVPLTLYLAGLAATAGVERCNDVLGRKPAFLVGGVVVLAACGLLYMLTPKSANWVYLAAAILGAGSTTMMILAQCLANDLLGEHAAGSAGFVFGAFSLMDKLANGLLILGVQTLKQFTCPSDEVEVTEQCGGLVRDTVVFLPAIGVLVAGLAASAITGTTKRFPAFVSRYTSFVEPGDQVTGEVWSDWVI